MQDRYAGDVGDFLKYSLLRWLAAPTASSPALSLGVVWYRRPDESHNADGKHISYLEPGNATGERLRNLDTDLHDRLRTVVMLDRSVAEVERSGALRAGTRTYPAELSFDGLPTGDSAGRRARRKHWLDGALAAVAGCDLVFADPDNGIRSADHSTPSNRDKSVKHAHLDELAAFAARGQSLVVYHHADRSATAQEQAVRRLDELADATGTRAVGTVRAARGTTRLFLIAGVGQMAEYLEGRLVELERSEWASELSVIWPTDLTLPTSSIADRPADLSDECRRLATAVLAITPVITTVADRRPNRIVSVERDGIMVHTEKSASTGSAQLVPAWMIEVAWDHLRRTGSLTQRHLLSTDGLNVKRSAFVLALLARFPGVRVVSTRPSELSFTVQ